MEEVIGEKQVLAREEIDPEQDRFSAILLRRKLREMLPAPFSMERPLTELDLARIRYHLFPEVRIHGKVSKVQTHDSLLFHLENLETMDLHQESLAKQIGDQHRLIRGVAGSGKTLILASRAHLLAKEHPDWNILVLCFNISLSRGIQRMIQEKFKGAGLPGEAEPDSREDPRVQFPRVVMERIEKQGGQIPDLLENCLLVPRDFLVMMRF